MNVKNKIFAFVMSFVICFGTFSNSFANDKEYINIDKQSKVPVALTPQMIGVIGSLGVASGVVFSSNDQIVNFAYDFYQRNKDIWDTVDSVFKTCVTIGSNQVVKVGKEFLNYFNEFIEGFSKTDINNNIKFGSYVELGTVGDLGLEIGESFKINTGIIGYYTDYPNLMGNVYFYVERYSSNSYHVGYSVGASTRNYVFKGKSGTLYNSDVVQYIVQEKGSFKPYINVGSIYGSVSSSIIVVGKSASAGSVSMDKVNDNLNDDDSVGIYVPGNVGSLVGSPSGSTVYDGINSPSYDLPIGGSVSMPTVNDKYQVGLDTPFVEGVDVPVNPPVDVPSDSIWSTIKDFVVSLVVPSDTFWTDTFNGFRDNFSKNFPMLDMSKFDSLAVGGKPFPNLYAYGSKIVDGDVINSIVDWLRPIIAGFIMICLMFFNYRKIYKLIRNTEPFGGIAQGSSDFRTGLSAPPINNGLDSNPMGNLRDTLFDMRNEILRRENSK